MKKVLIITYYWPPSGGAGVQRWLKFVKYLQDFDWQPFVLTVDPEYATYPAIDKSLEKDIPSTVKVFYTKTAEPFSLYKKIFRKKGLPQAGQLDEMKSFSDKIIRFVRGNFFVPDPRKGWNNYAYEKAKEIIQNHRIDTVVTTSPPHSTQLIGLKLKKELGIKWIADLRDPWTDIYYYSRIYRSWLAKKLDKLYERQVLESADRVIVVSSHIKRIFLTKSTKINEHKFYVLPNGFDAADFEKVNHNRIKQEHFTITYTGTMSEDYPIDGLLEVLKEILANSSTKIILRIIGSIPSSVKSKIEKALGNNFEFVSYVAHEKLIDYTVNTSALLLIIPNHKDNKGILTGKLFEYLVARRPILLIGPVDGDAADIVRETQSGSVSAPDDIETLKKNILFYLDLFKKDNLEINSINIDRYSRKNLTKDLVQLFEG